MNTPDKNGGVTELAANVRALGDQLREVQESGSDGRNAWDFDANEAESGDAYDEINMNCLWAQEP